MITISEYKNKAVGVFGLGKAGNAAVASLAAGGAHVFAWDDGEASRAALSAHYGDKVTIKPFDQWPWAEIKTLVLAPGVPLTHPKPHPVVDMAHASGCAVIGDVEMLHRAQPQARYIVITGTNGKSTTTTLIGHILKTAGIKTEIGGNLGTPALALAPLGKDGVYVVEASSYQLDLVKTTRFNVAVLLNVTPDHLDRHGSMQGYVLAKKKIFDRQQKDDTAVIAVDDEYTREVAKELKAAKRQRVVEVSAQSKQEIFAKDGVLYDGAQAFDLKNIITLTGRHNWQNACVSYAAAKAVGIAPDAIYKAMQGFGGLRHRLQQAATINGVRFINDSKATNADATSNALAPYDTIYWILGGKPKAGGIETLTGYFPKIAHAFLIGQASDEFAATLQGKASYTKSGTLAKALEQAAGMAFAEKKKGAVVLLSPACASFDQFKSFEERGDVFCNLVEQLAKKVAA